MNISDRPVALVTGSSRGIGRGIALRLAKDGYDLIINGVSADPSNLETGAYRVKRIIEDEGGVAEVFRADISSREDRAALIEFIEERFGRLDLLVNNAGIEPKSMDILESPEEAYDYVMNINLKGPYFLTQQIAKRMVAWKESGIIKDARIVFVTSVQGYMSNPMGANYCLTKAGLGMATKLFAHRLGEYGIPVIEISPGVIHSDMADKHQENIDRKIADGWLVTSRWGESEEVAALVSAIGNGDLDYSTGSQIEVGGGLGLRRL